MPSKRAVAGFGMSTKAIVSTVLSLASVAPHPLFSEKVEEDPNEVYPPALYSALDYRMIGPHRGGRVTAVAGIAQQPSTFYMGSTGGGVWKSVDYGLRWDNVSDGYFAVSSIGAIDVADSDPAVVYVGTGSACIRSNVITGRGVYKSTDAGKSWSFVGLPEAGAIGDLLIHPANPEIAYVAALGHPFGPNPERGVYRTRSGGRTWEKVLYVSERTGAVDLAMDPRNPRHIYAAMWQAERKPWTIKSGGQEGGLYKTVDGGDTWKKLDRGLPQGLVGKIAVDVAPSFPDRVYALVEAPGEARGLYRSDDGGASFIMTSRQKSLLYRPFYYTHLTVDPLDENKLYVNNESFWISRDGGRSFDKLRTPHGDNHDMWVHPEDPQLMIQANDGGANVSRDGGRSWSPQWNQPTAELYQVEVDREFPYRVYGAQQDNSTISVPSKVSRRPLDPKQDWLAVSGCETGPVVVHPHNADLVYGGCKGRHSIWNRRTDQIQQYWVYPHYNYGHDTSQMPYRFQRTAPMILSPHDPEVIYHGSHVVHRSTDGGRHWQVISPDLTANDPETQGYSGEPITHDITGEEIYSAIYAIAESPHEAGVLWVGANDGPIHISRDGGESWRKITPPDLPGGGRVNRIEPSPHRAGRAYVAVYRYQLDDWSPYLYRTDDYGDTWKRLTDGKNGIPEDFPVRVVREDPDREDLLYAGTEFGMYVSFDGGAHWQSLQLDLPVTPITDLKVHEKDLVLSTMGRSFWILDDLTPLHQLTGELASRKAHLFAPREAYRARWVGSLEERFPGYAPDYPPTGAMIHYYLGETPTDDITLDILDERGDVVQNASSAARHSSSDEVAPRGRFRLGKEAGMYRVVWDLRYPGAHPLNSNDSGTREPRRNGPLAVPGRYQVRLTIGEWQETRDLELRFDPRIVEAGIAADDLREQFDLAIRIRDGLNASRDAVRKIRSIRSQMTSVADHATGAGYGDDIEERAAAAVEKLSAIEKALVQTEKGKVGAELEPQLDGQFTYLYGMINGADQRPGQDAFLRFADLRKILDSHLSELQEILDGDVAEFNRMMRDRQVPAVIVKPSPDTAVLR